MGPGSLFDADVPTLELRNVLTVEEIARAWRERWGARSGDDRLTSAAARRFVNALLREEPSALTPAGDDGAGAAPSFDRLACLRDVLRGLLAERVDHDDADRMLRQVDETIANLLDDAGTAQRARLEAEALTDPLTGLWNRRALERDLERELARSQRSGREVAVVVLDLDGLKDINDADGHAAGDRAITQLATAFTTQLRTIDSMYRIGGDEFVLVLPETPPHAVDALLDRVAAAAPAFSAGVATGPSEAATVQALVDRADQRLVRSRRKRRLGRTERTAPEPEIRERSDGGGRVVARGLSIVDTSEGFGVEVSLALGEEVVTGAATGAPVPQAQGRAVVEATLQALAVLGFAVDGAHVDAATITGLGTGSVALVSVVLPRPPGPQLLTGTAPVRAGDPDALVRATLDAVMRFLLLDAERGQRRAPVEAPAP